LPYARLLATALQVPVELLHAIDPDIIAVLGHPRYVEREPSLEAIVKERQLRYLTKVESLFPEPLRVSGAVELGSAEELILAKARTVPNTLVVMATHGHSGLKRWLLGSIAEKVLRGATTPLLLIRATEEGSKSEVVALQTLIVPLDGSPLAESALPYAVELARTLDLAVVLVRAFSLPMSGYLAEEQAETGHAGGDRMGKEAQAYLDEKTEQLRAQGVKKIATAAVDGPAADTIINLAREKPNSLVVMCTHGRSGVRKWMLGSVTERIAHHSHAPLLIIQAASDHAAS
jgi:nucleotide-binding universal stress UspA family protein